MRMAMTAYRGRHSSVHHTLSHLSLERCTTIPCQPIQQSIDFDTCHTTLSLPRLVIKVRLAEKYERIHLSCQRWFGTTIPRMRDRTASRTTVICCFIARCICLLHLIFSVFVLLIVQSTRYLVFVPIIGIGLTTGEIILFSIRKSYCQYPSLLLSIYAICTIPSIWFLESYRIAYLLAVNKQQAAVEVFSVMYYTSVEPTEKFFLSNKYLWSQIQIQMFVSILAIVKGLSAKKSRRLSTFVTTWAITLDSLDFIDLLSYPRLYSSGRFVRATFAVWSLTCLQFLVETSALESVLTKRNYSNLASTVADSLLGIVFLDVPYLSVRLYAIIGMGKHDYTNYFLTGKNLIMIILQATALWTSFRKDVQKRTNGSDPSRRKKPSLQGEGEGEG